MQDPMPEDAFDDDRLLIVDLEPARGQRRRPADPARRRRLRWGLGIGTVVALLVLALFLKQEIFPVVPSASPLSTTASTSTATEGTFYYTSLAADQHYTYIFTNASSGTGQQSMLDVVDAQNGKVLWSYTGPITGDPVIGNGIIYLAESTGLTALRASDHKVLWTNPTINAIWPANTAWQIANNILYTYNTTQHGVIALRASDGQILWQDPAIAEIWDADNGILLGQSSTPDLDFIAVRASDGQVLWHYPFPNGSTFRSDGTVLCVQSTTTKTMQVVTIATGQLLWQRTVQGELQAVANGVIYTTSTSQNTLEALDASTGASLWHFSYHMQLVSSLQVIDGIVYLSVPDDRASLDVLRGSDGQMLWQLHEPGSVNTAAHGIAYVINAEGNGVDARTVATGTLLWHSSVGGSSISATAGKVYIMNFYTGIVAALSEQGTALWTHMTQLSTLHGAFNNAPGSLSSVQPGHFLPRDSYRPIGS